MVTQFNSEEGGLGGGGLDTVSDHPWRALDSHESTWGSKRVPEILLYFSSLFVDAFWTPFDMTDLWLHVGPFSTTFWLLFRCIFRDVKNVVPERCF